MWWPRLGMPTTARATSGWPDGRVIHGRAGIHGSIDFANRLNDPIYAVADGIVVKTGREDVTGNFILLKHRFCNGLVLLTRYVHLNAVAVSLGQKVKQGQIIGYAGNSGVEHIRVHLHLDTHVCGEKALADYKKTFGWPNTTQTPLIKKTLPNCYLVPSEPLVQTSGYGSGFLRQAKTAGLVLFADRTDRRSCIHPAWWLIGGAAVAGATVYGWKKLKAHQELGAVHRGRLLDIRARQVKEMAPRELPRHVYPYAEFMVRQSKKTLTPRDLVKAYVITRSSVRRDAVKDTTARYGSKKRPGHGWPGHQGKASWKVRPEDFMANLLVSTKAGHEYLNAAARGEVDHQAIDKMLSRFPYGLESTLKKDMIYAAKTLSHKTPQVAKALQAPKKQWHGYINDSIKGISWAKAGFLSSLLGRGDSATADARELSFWTCPPQKWDRQSAICCLKWRRNKKGEWVCSNLKKQPDANAPFVAALNQRMKGLRIAMPARYRPHYLHLAHHAVWDAINHSATSHRPMIKAMELAGDK